MDKLTFKNYPPSILTFLICLIVAFNLAFTVVYRIIWKDEAAGFFDELLIILLSYSVVLAVLNIINKYFAWKWLFKLLGLPYLKGEYIGTLTSSYHVDEDISKPHIQLYCVLNILQNINALKIEGDFYTDKACKKWSSGFKSSWEETKKKDDENFIIRYFFSNKGSQLHPDNKKYGLTNHDGVSVFTLDPKTNTLKGYYFNHERFSNGEISVTLKK